MNSRDCNLKFGDKEIIAEVSHWRRATKGQGLQGTAVSWAVWDYNR